MAKKAKAKARVPVKRKPYRARRFGIANHYGDVWTPETFYSAVLAQEHLDQQRPIYGGLPKHKVVPVRVTISIA